MATKSSQNIQDKTVNNKEENNYRLEQTNSTLGNINLAEFFDFLSCAYQLNIDLGDNDGGNAKIDWNKLSSDGLLSKLINFHQREMEKLAKVRDPKDNILTRKGNGKNLYVYDAKTNFNSNNLLVGSIQDYLNCKVENILDEGLLDSIMPFMVPKINSYDSSKKNPDSLRRGSSDNLVPQQSNGTDNIQSSDDGDLKDIEIDIQVCDELRHKTKMFKCPRDILLEKMQYFADVTSGQKLEDMDISVHCDLTIFEWLMKWVKSPSDENKPILYVQNVIQVLVSATFLQMEPLIFECITFFRQNIDEVIKTASTNLSCLNDAVISKIADALTNIEVDAMNDPKDKMQSRLFCKFIIALFNKSQNFRKGHFSSLAYLYKCSLCKKILHTEYGHFLPCLPKNIKLDTSGNLIGVHELDETWNLNTYIKDLKGELKTWRKVYWKLWGRCHYLKCAHCSCYYSVCFSNWCRYHEQFPQFFPCEDGRPSSIVGKYMCCGAKTYRFEVLPTPTGCSFRPHRPHLDSQLRQLAFILDTHSKFICINPPKRRICTSYISKGCEMLTDGYDVESDTIKNEYFWWHELELSQSSLQSSLHKRIASESPVDDHEETDDIQDADVASNSSKHMMSELSSEIYSSSDELDSTSIDEDDISDEESSTQAQANNPRRRKKYNRMRAIRAQYTKRWLPKLSVRCNQDNQREKEERIMRNYIYKLTNKPSNSACNDLIRFQPSHSLSSRYSTQDDPKLSGGTYALMEQEWKESLKQPSSPKKRANSLKFKMSGKQTCS